MPFMVFQGGVFMQNIKNSQKSNIKTETEMFNVFRGFQGCFTRIRCHLTSTTHRTDRGASGAHDASTIGDPMTYGYQIVDLVEIYQNMYNMSYIALQTSALLGIEKWSIFDPKINIMIKQVTI
jgi:hypothetical protein